MPHFLIILALSVVSAYGIFRIARPPRSALPLPPGPKGIPFFGNLFQLSKSPWKEFEVWKDEFGPLVYVTAANQGILVLNSHDAAADLLDRRSHIYSERPRLIVANEILSGGLSLSFGQPNKTWRKMHRASHESLTKARVAAYRPIQRREAVTLVGDLLEDPSQWTTSFRRAGASTILSILYGLPPIRSADDPLLSVINEYNEETVRAASPGAHLVETFPWMKHLPSWIAKWKKDAEQGFEKYSRLFGGLFHDVEDRMNEGDESPSFSATLIKERERHGLRDLEATWLVAIMIGAGFDTSTATMLWFILAMIAHPDKQRKCQDELDEVVGRSRLPTFEDMGRLPYLRATVRELLRWRAVLPTGVPHCTKEDDWYQGYFIPRGTICIANIWCLNRERAVYGVDADDFNPDRFIGEDGEVLPAIADTKEGHVTYGFGKRICMGRHAANQGLFINIATILWAANISPLRDETGAPIIPNTLESENAEILIRPLAFECTIEPRFPEAAAIIARTRGSL